MGNVKRKYQKVCKKLGLAIYKAAQAHKPLEYLIFFQRITCDKRGMIVGYCARQAGIVGRITGKYAIEQDGIIVN